MKNAMKRAWLPAVLALAVLLPASAETYVIDPVHSVVSFKIRHLVSNAGGRFNKFSGTIVYDEKDPSSASVEAVIETASIDTAVANRDAHLRSPDFFDTEKFPELTFKSQKVVPGEGGSFKVLGELSMHGVTKEVALDCSFRGRMKVREDWPEKAGFSAGTVLKRTDFGVGDPDTIMLGDDITISLEIEASAKPAEEPKAAEEPAKKAEEKQGEKPKKEDGKKAE